MSSHFRSSVFSRVIGGAWSSGSGGGDPWLESINIGQEVRGSEECSQVHYTHFEMALANGSPKPTGQSQSLEWFLKWRRENITGILMTK